MQGRDGLRPARGHEAAPRHRVRSSGKQPTEVACGRHLGRVRMMMQGRVTDGVLAIVNVADEAAVAERQQGAPFFCACRLIAVA